MGIGFSIRQFLDEPTTWWIAFVGLHLLGILYFGYVHGFLFRNRQQSGGFAAVLNLVGIGMGQAYNRQVVKGIIALLLFIVMIYVNKEKMYDEDKLVWIFLGFYILAMIDASWSATKAQKKLMIKSRNKQLQSKAKSLLKYPDHKFAVDTNILMHEPDLLVYLLENENMDLYMSMMVFNELDGLKKNDNPLTRKKAQIAFDVIEEFQRRKKLHILKTPKTDAIRKFGLSGSPDEKIIGTYLLEKQKEHDKLMFLSNDKGARIIARNVGMPVVEL